MSADVARVRPSAGFSRGELRSVVAMGAFVALLHLVGWGVLLVVVAPERYAFGSTGALGAGVGLTAYLLGARHAFDADHIASIDNTTRKLVGEGTPAVSTGFWFSLGHSTVVFVACLLLAVGTRGVADVVQDEQSPVAVTLATAGSLVAGSFLLLIGLSNVVAARGILRVLRSIRAGRHDETELERHLHNRGFIARILTRVTRRVSRPWHLYPVGLLMGLGFDTASQVALLVLAAGSAAVALPWFAVLTLPVLFAAGMSLFDTVDGILMTRAYGWAYVAPVRKAYYNLTVTLLSVAVALGIGSLVLLELLAERLDIRSGPLGWLAQVNLTYVGFGMVVVLLLAWGTALLAWRLLHLEERWPTEPTEPTE